MLIFLANSFKHDGNQQPAERFSTRQERFKWNYSPKGIFISRRALFFSNITATALGTAQISASSVRIGVSKIKD